MNTTTSEAYVQKRAYELFLERGSEHGHDKEDWFRAENELNGKKGSSESKNNKRSSARRQTKRFSRPKNIMEA